VAPSQFQQAERAEAEEAERAAAEEAAERAAAELRRLAGVGRQHEADQKARVEAAARDEAKAERRAETTNAVHAALKDERNKARAKFRDTLKKAGAAAITAAALAAYGMLLVDAFGEALTDEV
jgi:hypothetical protein